MALVHTPVFRFTDVVNERDFLFFVVDHLKVLEPFQALRALVQTAR
ncbi:MAG: hypothetical protein ACTIIZ_03465 [Levilactobacillus brevis]|nr:hypothetical protein N624_0400 [Levilactobacillus brevis]KIO98781.1 hypothetical protein QP38_1470 [Levilactobacillus brevis]